MPCAIPHVKENSMKIQVNTDVHIEGNEALAARVSSTVEQALKRFGDDVTRIEVHLGDENGRKSGQQDHRCMLEARLEGRQPVAVTEYAATLEQAVHGAAQKLARMLDSTLGRLRDPRDRGAGSPSPGTEPASR